MKKLQSILKVLGRVVLLSLLVWMVVGVHLLVAVHYYGQTDRVQRADVLIVLGAGLRYDGEPGPALLRRTLHAAAVYKDGYAPMIICTGGIPQGRTISESEGCRDVLIDQGVPAEAILIERRSRSTEENATYARELMDENGFESAIVVSDAYHLLRAQWIFNIEGITVYTSPTVNPPVGIYVFAVSREIVALHWQVLKEALQLPVTYLPTL